MRLGMVCIYAADRPVPAFGLIRRVTRSRIDCTARKGVHVERDQPVVDPGDAKPDNPNEAENDEGLDEDDLTDAASFPASDPPSWASGNGKSS
jgi:hypothetical protein